MSHSFYLDLIVVTSMSIFSNQITPVQSCCCEFKLLKGRCYCNFFGCNCDKQDERFSCWYGFSLDFAHANCEPDPDTAACPRTIMSRSKHFESNQNILNNFKNEEQ